MLKKTSFVVMVLLLVGSWVAGYANEVVTLEPIADCYTSVDLPDECFCDHMQIVVDDYNTARGYVRFDLSGLPERTAVEEAYLKLYCDVLCCTVSPPQLRIPEHHADCGGRFHVLELSNVCS